MNRYTVVILLAIAIGSSAARAGDLSQIKACVFKGYSALANRHGIVAAVVAASFISEGKLELLNTAGNVVSIELREVKGVYFVREFGDSESLTRKTFTSRPRTEGLWVRLRFRDNETIEGMMPNALLQVPSSRSTSPAVISSSSSAPRPCAPSVPMRGRWQRHGAVYWSRRCCSVAWRSWPPISTKMRSVSGVAVIGRTVQAIGSSGDQKVER